MPDCATERTPEKLPGQGCMTYPVSGFDTARLLPTMVDLLHGCTCAKPDARAFPAGPAG